MLSIFFVTQLKFRFLNFYKKVSFLLIRWENFGDKTSTKLLKRNFNKNLKKFCNFKVFYKKIKNYKK